MEDELYDLVNPYTTDPEDWKRVVRCKNCKFFSELLPGTEPICLKYGGDFKTEDYCSKGAERE